MDRSEPSPSNTLVPHNQSQPRVAASSSSKPLATNAAQGPPVPYIQRRYAPQPLQTQQTLEEAKSEVAVILQWLRQRASAVSARLTEHHQLAPVVLNHKAWERRLRLIHDSKLSEHAKHELLHALQQGVDIRRSADSKENPPETVRSARNLKEAQVERPDHDPRVSLKILQDIKHEVEQERKAGPFLEPPFYNLIVSPLGAVPKKNSLKLRVIQHLSWPRRGKGVSVNDQIVDYECQYTRFTDVVRAVGAQPKGTLMAKYDIRDAFRLIRVRLEDQFLLGTSFVGWYFYERCLPFGLRSAPAIFEVFATAIELMGRQQGLEDFFHYLDDFFKAFGIDPVAALQQHHAVLKLFDELGVPLAMEKVVDPATSIEFLGITIDSWKGEIRLPQDKLDRIQLALRSWRDKKSGTLKQLQSLLGYLVYAARVVQHGRTFYHHIIQQLRAAGDDRGTWIVLGPPAVREVGWWCEFLPRWNGVQIIAKSLESFPLSARRLVLTDACKMGMGAWFPTRRMYLLHAWTPQELQLAERDTALSMPFLELLAAVSAVYIWRKDLSGQAIDVALDLKSDCSAVVEGIQKGYSKTTSIHELVRALLAVTNAASMFISASHIAGVKNAEADALSRSAHQNSTTEQHSLNSLFFSLESVQNGHVTRTAWDGLPSAIWPEGNRT